MTKLSPQTVVAVVARYWDAMMSKSSEVLEEYYAHESSVFSTSAVRTEPGRLAATRRAREYFGPRTSVRVTTNSLEVIPVGESAAIATYTFQLHATRTEPLSGRTVEEEIRNGRATQVFALDPEDNLRIIHEHLSVATRS